MLSTKITVFTSRTNTITIYDRHLRSMKPYGGTYGHRGQILLQAVSARAIQIPLSALALGLYDEEVRFCDSFLGFSCVT